MGQALIVPGEERAEGATDEFAHLEATFDLSYDVAKWLECAAHFSTSVPCETNMACSASQASAWTFEDSRH
jgi:hypothetical protein